MEPDWVVRFHNQRATAVQQINKGKHAFRWTRLSCKQFRDNWVRLQLHALADNLATFLRCLDLPEAMAGCCLTSLQLKLIEIGARIVCRARAITFQLAEVVVTGPAVRAIRRLRPATVMRMTRDQPYRKMLASQAPSDDLDVKRQATWGMSVGLSDYSHGGQVVRDLAGNDLAYPGAYRTRLDNIRPGTRSPAR